MSEPVAPFRVVPDYLDRELDAISRALWARQAYQARPPWGIATILLGAAASLGASFLAVALGSARPRDGTPVLLFMALYWLGVGAEGMRLAWARRRGASTLRDDLRRALRDMILNISERGVAVRQHGTRAFYAWSAINDGELARGLLWLDAEPGHLIAIPDRLLTPEQRAWLLERTADPWAW